MTDAILKCILIGGLSTLAIVAVRAMSIIEPENNWYTAYAAAVNLVSVFLYGLTL